jgi:hypothetical protein
LEQFSMPFQRIARSFVLNALGAAAALAGTLYITWFFGLAEFAYYTINFAKLALILLGLELLPSSFAIFRLQEDDRFTSALPVFYLSSAIVAAGIAGVLLVAGTFVHSSWFMLVFVISTALQRYLDVQAQASGRVDAFFWIPASSNIARLLLLAGLAPLKLMPVPDLLWSSVAIGGIIGQAVMLSRFPEFLDRSSYHQPLGKLRYLWSIRASYYGYYVNSVLKRLRDTFLPLFCDLVIPSKAEIGRLLVFTRANDAVCGQVRVLEAFMVNRAIRDDLRHARRRIFWTIAPLGQAGVAVIALLLMYRQGIDVGDVFLATVTGLFIYPYILELFWRNDALASFRPRQVTISLLAFLVGLTLPPLISLALGVLDIPILIVSYVLGQVLAAGTYRLFPQSRETSFKEAHPR